MKQISAEACLMVQIWEQGEGKTNSFLPRCKALACREQAQRWGRALGSPWDAGAMLGGRDQMEMGGCTEAGGELSTWGLHGRSNALAMSVACPGVTACARLRVESLHSPAQKWFSKTQPLHWVPSQPLKCLVHVAMDMLSWEVGETQQGHLKGPRQSLGLLLPPFTDGETAGIKKNNEQRMWAGPLMFFLTPDQICTLLCVGFAFLWADGGG